MHTFHTCSEPARVLQTTHFSGPLGSGQRNAVAHVFEALAAWNARYRARCDLLSMNDHQLRDIGIDRARARELADRTFRIF